MLTPPTVTFLLLAVATVGALRAEDTAHPAAVERVARWFSRDVRESESRMKQLTGELEKLPALHRGNRGSQYGFHSGTIFEQKEPQWVQLDLGRSYPIDTIVAMPVDIATIEMAGEGFGFPLRFKVEVSDDAEMKDATMLVDRTAGDVENPGSFPMVLRTGKATGRYVRFTSTRHVPSKEGFFWALDELMVLSGNRNVAIGTDATASSQLELLPSWSVGLINDGLSALGMPVTVKPSPASGYLSAPSDQPMAEKWVVVDLGKEFAIDEIRLLPAESRSEDAMTALGFPRLGGRAFPRQLAVELSAGAEFEKPLWRAEISSKPAGYPWGSPVVMQCRGQSARYIRVLTRELWPRGKNIHHFALAELQAYAGNENVALGKPVRVKDAADGPKTDQWAPEFLVDGFTSRHPLVELPEYLGLIAQRGRLEKEQATLRALRDRKVQQVSTTLTLSGGILGSVALVGWVWMLVRQKVVRRRDVARLRAQIARDLHDDIGSNLGGIVLLSEMGTRHRDIADEVRSDFASIRKAAEETAESMRDIVWLIQPGSLRLRELIVKLRKSIGAIVGNLSLSVVVDPPEFRDRDLSLAFSRHWFFAFKETLNNVRRHAAAGRVEVKIEITATHLAFTVHDDGLGFDPKAVAGLGHGLNNLQQRAARLKGSCHLESTPGHGTTVTFKAPLNSDAN